MKPLHLTRLDFLTDECYSLPALVRKYRLARRNGFVKLTAGLPAVAWSMAQWASRLLYKAPTHNPHLLIHIYSHTHTTRTHPHTHALLTRPTHTHYSHALLRRPTHTHYSDSDTLLTALEKLTQATARSKSPSPTTFSVLRLTESQIRTWGCSTPPARLTSQASPSRRRGTLTALASSLFGIQFHVTILQMTIRKIEAKKKKKKKKQ